MNSDQFFQFFLASTKQVVSNPAKEFLWLTIPAGIVGFCALFFVIIKFVKMFAEAEVCRVALTDASEVEINRTGELDICLEVPMLTFMAGSGLEYQLFNKRDNREIPLSGTAAALMSRKSCSTMTFTVRKMRIEETGTYLLKVSGFKPQVDYSAHVLKISEPTALKSILYIFGIILASLMFVGGFVLSIILTNAPN